jgi:hypothetical protein
MDADESRHLLKRHRDDAPKFDGVAFAFFALSIGAVIWGISQWNADQSFANIYRIVSGPIAAYLLLGIFGLDRRRVKAFIEYISTRR